MNMVKIYIASRYARRVVAYNDCEKWNLQKINNFERLFKTASFLLKTADYLVQNNSFRLTDM